MGIEEKHPSGVLLTTVEGVAGYFATQSQLRAENEALRARLLEAAQDAQRYGAAAAEAAQLRRLMGAAERIERKSLTAEILYAGSKEKRDVPRARELYRLAATDGHPFAMYMTGYLMIEAHEDLFEAMAWLKLSADDGIPQAQQLLDQLDATARGMPRGPGETKE